nr:unnamed protein product [Spirometra erinaceieuropaei]
MKSLKFGIDRRVSDLESARMEISRMKETGAENRKRLEELAQQCDLLKQRLAIITDSKLTAEQMVHEAEKQLQQEENYKAELTRVLVSLRKEHYEITNTLRTVTEEKVLTQIKIDSSISALKNLHATVSKLNEETRRQQDIKYNLSLQIESMERRIAPLQDDVNEEQIAALKEQIQARTKELEMQTAIQKTLSNQLVQVQTDVLHCQRSIASLKKEYDAVEYRMSTDELYVDQTQKALDLAEKEKNNMLVEENMLRLQLTRLTRLLDNHNEQVFDLEKQRLQLKVFANERELDLKMYMDNLRSELNINAEEKSRLSIELQSKKMQVGKTRNRFEIASVKLAPPAGEEAHSQAYYIIKASQQRSALKAQGDQLDREIAQGVKELEALENTLSVMNGCNRNYRQSHMEVPEDSELSITKQELEEALKLSLLTGAIKRRHNTELRSKCKEYLESSAGVEAELANLNNAERLLTEKAELREKELKSLQERLVRAQRCMKKAKATARETTKLEADAWEHFSDDIKVRLIGELFDNLVALIFRGIKVATNELAQERAQIYLSAAGFPTSARTQRSGPTPSSLSLTGSCHSLASLTSSLSSSARSDAMMTGSHVTSPASSQSSIASVNSPPRGSGSLRSVDMSSRVSFPGEGGSDSRSE